MSEYMYTIQEHNEYNGYDRLYPKTHASLIVNLPQATGARIDVTCLPASSGIVVNLSGQKTASATTDANGKCSFEGLDYGEYTISATIGGKEQSETVSIDASKIYDVELGIRASATLNDNDWATISKVSSAGLASSYWNVGDCKAINLNGTASKLSLNTTLYCYILDFNHDKSSVSGVADGITFGTFKTAVSNGIDVALCASNNGSIGNGFCMNTTATNSGGWKNSDMRYNILGSTNTQNGDATSTTATSPKANTLMSCLPSDLRAVMRPMYVYTDNTGGGSDTASYVTGTLDYLPLLAEYEVRGARTYANSAEQNNQTQYVYYKNGNSKKKFNHSSTSSATIWWVRSPSYYGSSYFCYVGTGGNADYGDADFSRGVAPMFKV